jgi:hypothetical protein
MMDYLIALAILVIAVLLMLQMASVVRRNQRLYEENQMYSEIIREANIRGVPPKDLGVTPGRDE